MSNISQHISKKFDVALDDIHNKVLGMGGLVEEQLKKALLSFINSEQKTAEIVIENEPQVNTAEVTIDQLYINILVRQQPAAGDLRMLAAISKTITDLERVGDEAEKIAKMAIELLDKKDPKFAYTSINSLGKFVSQMLHDALDAFAKLDSKLALEVALREPESDKYYAGIMRELITHMMENTKNISGSLDAIWATRSLERIGDHSKNICENVIYLVEGMDVRHISIEKMQEMIESDR
tara:strand:- start:111 stop:824 length:714 start_codon:yes stop_codon:yes gene_type:complete